MDKLWEAVARIIDGLPVPVAVLLLAFAGIGFAWYQSNKEEAKRREAKSNSVDGKLDKLHEKVDAVAARVDQVHDIAIVLDDRGKR